jgi:hypothetical protein
MKESNMKKLVVVILPIFMIGLAACDSALVGSGHVVTESRNISGVTAVRLTTNGNLTIEQGNQESLTIEADDNILPNLTSDVVNGKLELSVHTHGGFNLHSPIRYHLVVKEINELALMGSGDVTATAFSGDQVTITIMGSGDTSVDTITAKSLNINIQGSGDVNVASGYADTAGIQIMGSGSIRAENVKLGKAVVSVLGSGNSRLWVVDQLDVSFLGSGDVSYFGKPSISETHAGSGNLISLGAK